ncbi:MAG: phospholipid carrier-dependent glycosyltransferase [Dactylosporangium sp.]|nr:phospholipid carrier-dependent glycosyltransferase [Dactylosporangium sp.]NNJ61933.1 phospholipid carrier-dependent glycosyltransferase [Dactylosporangium sp.]
MIGVVTLIAAALRLIDLRRPGGKIFDEIFYAIEANTMLTHGVEWDVKVEDGIETVLDTPKYIVHPPLGKWCIALGEQLFGYNEYGWRISAAVFGTLSILLVIIVARRLFRSTLLGCAAGLLMSLDGLHFVLSRSALLDIFLMFFIVASFTCLVFDRDRRRAQWLRALEGGLNPNRRGKAGSPRMGFPWWRLAAAVCIGAAAAVKWSAIWYLLLFLLFLILWEAGTRRSVGSRTPWADTIVTQTGWMVLFTVVAVGAYLASWAGWFVTDDGYFRHWLADNNQRELPVIGALHNLWHYHESMWTFHTGLSSHHQYQSWPWQWLLLGRPVAFYWSGDGPCGAGSCAAEVLLLGTPLLWWSFLPALGALAWIGIARRDWRALAIGLGAAAGIVPWFWNQLDSRTMFYFYALPALPFLVLAVVYVLGAIIGPRPAPGASTDRRVVGAVIAGAYLLLIAACFAYFYPIYTGMTLTHAEWFSRMWLGGRWI